MPEPGRSDPLAKRRHAAALFARGQTRAEVARALGVSRATTTHWYRVWRAGGARALGAARRRGRPSRIEPRELNAVQVALSRGPRESGYYLERWTLAAVVALIAQNTGVTYHPRHVQRVLRRLGWVVSPVGRSAEHAFRQRVQLDPDGNRFFLRQRWASSRPSPPH